MGLVNPITTAEPSVHSLVRKVAFHIQPSKVTQHKVQVFDNSHERQRPLNCKDFIKQ